MSPIYFEKSAGADWPLEVNFGADGSSWKDLFSTDPIATATVTDWDDNALTGIVAGAPSINSTGLIVQTRLSGGVSGQTYYIKIAATSTTSGYVAEAFLVCSVKPDPFDNTLLLTVKEFRDFTGLSTTAMPNEQAEILCKAVTKVIENYVGRELVSAQRTEYYSGNGTKFVILRNYPVTSVTSVHLDQRGYFGADVNAFDSTAELFEGTDWALVKDGSQAKSGMIVRIPGVWLEYPSRRETFRLTRDLVPNHGNIKVVYTAGYTTIPFDIKMAAAQIIIKSKQYLTVGGPLKSERLGDHSYEVMRSFFMTAPDLGTVRQILSNYKDVGW